MGLMLVTDNYMNVLNLYNEAKDSGYIDKAFKIAMNNLPHKLEEIISIKLERFFNPEVKKLYPPDIEDYEDALKLCHSFMPEKVHGLALEFYNYFRNDQKWNDDAVDVAREYLPEKLEEAVTTRFNELMAEKENYYDALVLKDEFPELIDYNLNKLAVLAFKGLLDDYRHYSKELQKNEFLQEEDLNYHFKTNAATALHAICENVAVNNCISYEEKGAKIIYPLNLEFKINEIDKKIRKKTRRK